jgi:protein-L-isoaspartate(D-aspartate) O-methyltransferase
MDASLRRHYPYRFKGYVSLRSREDPHAGAQGTVKLRATQAALSGMDGLAILPAGINAGARERKGMKNVEQMRFNMVEQQIRPWDVLDLQVLDLLNKVKREQFVPSAMREMAFVDMEIPLGHGAFMWQPKVEARVLQAVRVKRRDAVLEVGSGSAYLTALLAYLAGRVTSVEIVPELHAFAERNLAAHRIDNVTLELGDAARGWPGSYDVIVLTGSVPVLPESFQNSLVLGGRMFAIVGDAPVMQARLITRTMTGKFESVTLFETSVAPLQNALQPERFVF